MDKRSAKETRVCSLTGAERLQKKLDEMHASEKEAKRRRTNTYNRRYYHARREAERKQKRALQLEQWRIAREAKAARRLENEAKRAAKAEAKRLKDEAKAAARLIPKHKKTRYFIEGFREGQRVVIEQLTSLAPFCACCTVKLQPFLK
jgi:hypothetical protein